MGLGQEESGLDFLNEMPAAFLWQVGIDGDVGGSGCENSQYGNDGFPAFVHRNGNQLVSLHALLAEMVSQL